ncbi:MAG: signal peptidase II [Oscillospiraceae bacterium]|nr:signal peptidase II [Oscillospiraceae bacterium]
MKNIKTLKLFTLVFAATLIGVDRLTKWLAVVYLKPVGSVGVININGAEILNLTYVENTGAAFSILQGQRLFLIITSCLLIIGALIFLFICKGKDSVVIWSLALIIAGGAGNLIDRVFYGYVVDFIDFRFINFAIFNFADICAVTGAFLFLFVMLREEIANIKLKKADSKTSETNRLNEHE